MVYEQSMELQDSAALLGLLPTVLGFRVRWHKGLRRRATVGQRGSRCEVRGFASRVALNSNRLGLEA